MSRGVRGALTLVLALGLGLWGACFNAPQPAVHFSCDPVDAPECPDGYTCEPDGCCHRVGTDFAANQGQCQLGSVPLPTSGGSTSEPSTTDASTTDAADSTGSTSTGSTSTGSTTTDSTTTDTGSSTGSSSESASTSDASSGSTTAG